MRRVLLALGLALSGVVLFQMPAHACSCVAGQTLSLQAQRATDVIIGTVQSRSAGAGSTTYDVRVERVYKGRAQAGQTVRTPSSEAACGVDLVADRRYLLLGNRQGQAVEVNSCGGSRPARARAVAAVTQLLGEGTAPPSTGTTPTRERVVPAYETVEDRTQPGFARLAAPGAAIALVGFLGFLLVRRVGRPH